MKVKFQKKEYQLIITDHARTRMELREINEKIVIEILETGDVKPKPLKNKFWVYKNNMCLSISIESPNLVVITALLNWRP